MPQWNARGQADYGTFADGTQRRCRPEDAMRCMVVQFPFGYFAYLRERVGAAGFWHGSLVWEQQDASRLMYRRNRYYDPATGQFTQEDPIGLAGGLNLYGFANGDPVGFSDPFGLKPDSVSVGCRSVGGTAGMGQHCAVRITNDRVDVTYELLNNNWTKSAGIASAEQVRRYDGKWVRVAIPNKMTDDDFDDAVMKSAQLETGRQNGRPYLPTGGWNSNRYVFNIIGRAGGFVPYNAARVGTASGFAPGLCGGIGLAMGSGCSGAPLPASLFLGIP